MKKISDFNDCMWGSVHVEFGSVNANSVTGKPLYCDFSVVQKISTLNKI